MEGGVSAISALVASRHVRCNCGLKRISISSGSYINFGTRLEKHTDEIAFADRFPEHAKSEEGNQYQKPDNAGCDKLVETATSHSGQGICSLPSMHKADDDLFERVQDQEQNKKGEGPVQCRPDERHILEPLANTKRAPNQYELGADESLHCSEAKWRKRDALVL
jgi:hypothetical protein